MDRFTLGEIFPDSNLFPDLIHWDIPIRRRLHIRSVNPITFIRI